MQSKSGKFNPSYRHGFCPKGHPKKEYIAWQNAKKRCFDVHSDHYSLYGARGITMCLQWVNSFATFIYDMGPCPPGLTLERKDVNGNYDPSNCEWATFKRQANNKRFNRHIEYQGNTYNFQQLADLVGVHHTKLRYRLKVGIPLSMAVNNYIDFRAGRKCKKG